MKWIILKRSWEICTVHRWHIKVVVGLAQYGQELIKGDDKETSFVPLEVGQSKIHLFMHFFLDEKIFDFCYLARDDQRGFPLKSCWCCMISNHVVRTLENLIFYEIKILNFSTQNHEQLNPCLYAFWYRSDFQRFTFQKHILLLSKWRSIIS